jgi:ABC-type amino acid transport system permease subunit
VRPARRASALYVAVWLAIGLTIGLLIRPIADRLESSPPRVGWGAATTLFVVAVVVGSIAWNTWQSLHKKHQRMTSDHAAKMLALSRSCVIVGALFAGGYGGFALAFVGDLDTPLGQERAVNGGVAALAGLVLLVVALLLERACRLPEDDDDETATDATPA